jgi:PAT family beta-lactamase induction signal transducer AmpG
VRGVKRRVHRLALLSISSGIPYGFIVTGALSTFLASEHVKATQIGLLSLVQAPWNFKFLWSPLIDRYALKWPGRRRSWILLSQLGILLWLAGFAWVVTRVVGVGGFQPQTLAWVGILAVGVAFFGATQDIALDAYAVEYLRPDEQAHASGLRTMYWRLGFLLMSGVAVALSDAGIWQHLGFHIADDAPWPWVFLAIALSMIPLMGVTLAADEPERPATPPRTLGVAVVEPLLSYFRRPQAIAFALFLFFYKFGDNLSNSMWIKFLVDHGIPRVEIGLLNKTVGSVSVIVGATLGGYLVPRLGLGRSLWIFGFVQGASNALYALASITGGVRWAVYLGVAGENLSIGLGTAALLTLCLRLCEKRFGATQYALLSSIFALGRIVTGPPAGWIVDHWGYTPLFLIAILAAVPGLAVLQVIAPIQQREVPNALGEPPEPSPSLAAPEIEGSEEAAP